MPDPSKLQEQPAQIAQALKQPLLEANKQAMLEIREKELDQIVGGEGEVFEAGMLAFHADHYINNKNGNSYK
jgi:hypothetical protein